ncbi:MAG: phosphatidylinositol kinase [Marinilabiliales bacterium]|nr:MAG: phosphatidylinositol kinase [Marinilabiliales bacterium]
MRKARVYMYNELAGFLIESVDGYSFNYDVNYLNGSVAKPVSLTLPLQEKPYVSRILFPFFDGLIPEGWLLEIAQRNWKLDSRDRMGLLLACCKDCIGAVSIEADNS